MLSDVLLLLNIFKFYSGSIFSWKQTILTQIRLLLKEQSDMGPYCLQYMISKNIHNREEQKKRVLTDWLTAKEKINIST